MSCILYHRRKPGSKQNFETPADLFAAFTKKFGRVTHDLAADKRNSKAGSNYYSEEQNSLKQHWHKLKGLLWLNPPFWRIGPWVEKCSAEHALGAKIAVLIPAAVSTNWFRDHVAGRAKVHFLNGGVSFDLKNNFMKDLMICVYGLKPGYEVWEWERDLPAYLAFDCKLGRPPKK